MFYGGSGKTLRKSDDPSSSIDIKGGDRAWAKDSGVMLLITPPIAQINTYRWRNRAIEGQVPFDRLRRQRNSS
ncbi:hypothetical protein [Alkalinema sp. FACHB-956]|uniref:hypothetical protein n=1 Tax=Alkalinema sp. FACHB-956 TaxID=2692768 RepID=UPI0016827E6C|nr:hypothetical protein [Alkalinema sp. FACHB-956]MBD2327627.1 hypothetical protein [Alkalinema sp. FACHB-956]